MDVITIGGVLLAVAVVLWLWARRGQVASGLPTARVAYDDADLRRDSPPLVDHQNQLTGKPDYLIELEGRLIPVELKPTRRASRPYDSDRLQLAAYCRLVEAHFGTRPPYGILRYASHSWEIPYTAALEEELYDTLDAMEAARHAPDVARSHQQAARCRTCSQRTVCDEALG